MVRVIVNGKEVHVPEGETILTALKKAGDAVPTLCFFGHMYREASCRMCLVELSNGKLVPACAYPVSDGLEVRTDTPRVREARRTVVEFILSIHRIRCWSCPRKGGNCELLKLATAYWVEGIPVCSSCPLYGRDCLVVKGEPCLGPITLAGCSDPCPSNGSPCIGCRGPVTRKDVLEAAAQFYVSNGVELRDVLEVASMFWEGLPNYDSLKASLEEAFKKALGGGED